MTDLRSAPAADGQAAGAIDPFLPTTAGRYDDALVVVEYTAEDGTDDATVRASVRPDGRVLIRHHLAATRLDDDIAEELAGVLAPLIDDHDVFARAFTGIVLTSASEPIEAWERFYRNSLARILDPARGGYAMVYRHALELLPRTSVLDLGCGFGFLSLRLAALGAQVTACDVDLGTLRLLRRLCKRLQAPVSILHSTSGLVPAATCSSDAVALLHVLEHVEPSDGLALVAEAMRVARRRVVIAVPYEDHPTRLYGHVRRFRADDLREIGARSGWRYDVHDHYGGWLVLDRPPPGRPRSPVRATVPQEGELQ